MQMNRSPTSSQFSQPFAQPLRPLRPRKQPFEQRPQIKSRAANHNRQMSARANLRQNRRGPPRVLAGGEEAPWFDAIWIDAIKNMIRRALTFRRARLRSSDLKLPVHG